jgi:hypothetical protein
MKSANCKLQMVRRWLAAAFLDLCFFAMLIAIAMIAAGCAFGQVPPVWSDAVCRISAATGPLAATGGTGTLIDDDGVRGNVVTCAHTFRDSRGPYFVRFVGDATPRPAELVALDETQELALLAIASPGRRPIPLALDSRLSTIGPLTTGGFGAATENRWRPVIGEYSGATDAWLKLAGTTRSGDSGGPVLNASGELVGVAWGSLNHEVYFGGGEPLRRFLDRCLPGRPAAIVPHASGWASARGQGTGGRGQGQITSPVLIRPNPQSNAPALPSTFQPAASTSSPAVNLAPLEERLTALENDKQDKGAYLTQDDLAPYAQLKQVPAPIATDQLATHDDVAAAAGGVRSEVKTFVRDAVLVALPKAGLAVGGPIGAAMFGISVLGRVLTWRANRRAANQTTSGAGGAPQPTFHSTG